MREWIVTSSVLILLALALRTLLKDKISLRLRYALWLVVAVRLLVPFQIGLPGYRAPGPPVAADLVPDPGPRWESPRYQVNEVPLTEAETSPDSPFYIHPDGTVTTSDSFGFPELDQEAGVIRVYADFWSPKQIALALWGTGIGLMAAALLWSNLRFARRLRKQRRLLAGTGAPLPVYTADSLPSPCLFGLIRPAIYLTPETAADRDRMVHVLAHEETHYAHKDHLWSLIRVLCLVIHWYNPLVWLAASLSKRDGELACDEGAVARLGEEARFAYGRTLVGLVSQRGSRPTDLLSCSTAMTEGKKTIQQRIALLVKKPETRKTALFAALALLALAVVFTFSKGSGSEYDQFRSQVEETQVVNLHLPPISSQFIPYHEISDPDLLAQAKDLLAGARPLKTVPAEDWVMAGISSPGLGLGDGAAEDCPHYVLYEGKFEGKDVTYVLLETNSEETLDYIPVAVLDWDAEEQLWALAREQYQRGGTQPGRCVIQDPGDVAAVQELLIRDVEFLRANAKLFGTTARDFVSWVAGGPDTPAPVWLEVEYSALGIPDRMAPTPCWTVTCWGEEEPLRTLYLPGDTLAAVLSQQERLVGLSAMLANDLQAEDAYFITLTDGDKQVVEPLPTFRAGAYDLVEITQDKGPSCEVRFLSLDAEPIFGTVQKSDLIFDPDRFRYANQAYLENAALYDHPNGAAVDTYSGLVCVEKRWEGWAQVARPGGSELVWVEESALGYDFARMWSGEPETEERVDDPEQLKAILDLVAEDEEFLNLNAYLQNMTREEILQTVTGGGDIPAPELLSIGYLRADAPGPAPEKYGSGWIMTAFGDGSMLMIYKLPDDTAERVLELWKSVAKPTFAHMEIRYNKDQLVYIPEFPDAEYPAGVKLRLSDTSEETPFASDVRWRSDNQDVCRVNINGAIQPTGVGMANITAEYDGHSVTQPVTIRAGHIRSIQLDTEELIALKGEYKQMYITAHAEGSNGMLFEITDPSKLKWVSGNEKVVRVAEDGMWSGEPGNTVLTASAYGHTAQVEVFVVDPTDLTLSVSEERFELIPNESSLLRVQAQFRDRSIDVTKLADWSVSDKKVVQAVDGIVSAEGCGGAVITVSYGGKSVTIPVRVLDPDLPVPEIPDTGVPHQEVADAYGEALVQYYLSRDSSDPDAVTYAKLARAEIYEQNEDALCAAITLVLDPLDPNTVHWMTGAGIDYQAEGPWAGHWLHTQEYRLERIGEGWTCTDHGTGGIRLS